MMNNNPKTREVKVVGTLYVGNKQYPLIRQEQAVGISVNVSTWTVINPDRGANLMVDGGELWVYEPPMIIATIMPWLIEYHVWDKFVTVLDDDKD